MNPSTDDGRIDPAVFVGRAKRNGKTTERPAEGGHPPVACDGLVGGCGFCITLYLAITGQDMRGEPPRCVTCDAAHWPWRPHWDPADVVDAAVARLTDAAAAAVDAALWGDINDAAALPPGSLGRLAAEQRCTGDGGCPVPWHSSCHAVATLGEAARAVIEENVARADAREFRARRPWL